MDTENKKKHPAVEAAESSGRQAGEILKRENIPKVKEGMVGQDTFEEWMGRIMERFDRQDRIISVLVNKDAAGVKYLDGERLYDNQDLCEMLRTSKRSLQRFRSKFRLRYQRIGHKTYYKESDLHEFIRNNFDENEIKRQARKDKLSETYPMPEEMDENGGEKETEEKELSDLSLIHI